MSRAAAALLALCSGAPVFAPVFAPILVPAAALADTPAPPAPMQRAEPQGPSDAEMLERLQSVLRAHGADVHGCYGVALAGRPGLRGEVLLRMWVMPGGAVERVDVLKDSVDNGTLTGCLQDSIRKWRVPELAGGDVQQIVFPLAFKPDDAKPEANKGKLAAAPNNDIRYVVPLSDGKPGPLPGGKLEVRVLVDESFVGPTRGALSRVTIKPSARIALHQHPTATEVLYVIRGMARVRSADNPAPAIAEAGDIIYCPAGLPHSIESAPLAQLELVQLFVPPGPQHVYLDPSARGATVAVQKKKGGTSQGGAGDPKIIKAGAVKPYPILGGKGEVALYLDGTGGAPGSVQRLEAEAGAKVPPHKHDTSDEILYILSGRGQMTVAGQTLPVTAGDAVHLPLGVEHALEVSEKLVAVQLYAPGGPEQRFKTPPQQPPATKPPAAAEPARK